MSVVTAKNLDASTVDLLLCVKVRCRRCAPLSVLGRRSIPRSATLAGVLEYPWSTMGTHAARTSTTDCAGVLHSVVECAQPTTLRQSLPWSAGAPMYPRVPYSTVEHF